jgi:amino acid permease
MKNKTAAAAWAANITIVTMLAIIIVAEYSAAFNGFLASLTGHHWVTKSVFEAILFVVLFVVLGLVMKKEKKEAVGSVLSTAIVAVAACAVFFGFLIVRFLQG